jgi:hypothetical protein
MEKIMNLSFKEKSLWTSLIITIVIFGYYFSRVFSALNQPTVDTSGLITLNQPTVDTSGLITLFIGVVFAMIVLEIVSHITLTAIYKKEANDFNDERDKLIELKAIRISYYILILGVFQAVVSLLMGKSPIMSTNIILLFFVVAQIAGDITQLVYYRKGI